MVRAAALIAIGLAALPATAQTNTQCRWIGNVWSCNQSSASTPSPIDQGAILRSGAAVVPPYRPTLQIERETTPIPPPVSLTDKYAMDADGAAFVNDLLEHCRSGESINSLPADRQQLVGVVCFAFDQGRIAEILRNRQ